MKKILIFSLALVFVSACTKEQIYKTVDNNEICFNFSIGQPCSLMTKATATEFEQNDSISLYAVEYDGDVQIPLQVAGNYFNNEKLIYDGKNWDSVSSMFWSNSACDYYAIYPYQKTITSIENFHFSVSPIQDETGYKKSDLLYSKAINVSKEDGSVNLIFRHMLARCVVNIIEGETFEGTIPEDIEVHIYNTLTDASFNLFKGAISSSSLGEKQTITMHKINNWQFEAIVVPQNIESLTPLIEISMGGIAYLYNSSISFKGGYTHTFNVILNSSPEQEQIEISIDPSIKNW